MYDISNFMMSVHPKDINFKRLSKSAVLFSKMHARFRSKYRIGDPKVFAKNRNRRLEKYIRDRRAALMNPAWKGQPWVEARYGWDPEEAIKSRLGK